MDNDDKVTHWNRLIDEFRSFGGTAENVIQREGSLGLGLFPIDPSQRVELRVPDHLLVVTDNIELQDGAIVIKDASHYPAGFDDWYRRFQADYSWGAEAKRSIETFENGLASLPKEIRQLLENRGLILEERLNRTNGNKSSLQRFIATRRIRRKDKNVLMPIIELVNHSPLQTSWDMDDESIGISGTYDEEILVRYSICDPLHRFLQYGFNCNEINGFSLNLKVIHRGKTILIRGGINNEPGKPPKAELSGDKIIINKPMIGSTRMPRMPRTLFKEGLKSLRGIDSNEVFDQICQANRLITIKLIKLLECQNEEIAQQLRISCFEQLIAIGYHFGEKSTKE